MLINAVFYTFPAEKADEAAALLHSLRNASLAEPGCAGYEVSRAIDDPNVFVLYEQWRDQAALNVHLDTPHFQQFGVNGIRPIATSRVAYKSTLLP